MPGSVILPPCVDILIGISHQTHYRLLHFCLPFHPLDCRRVALLDTYNAYGGTNGFLHLCNLIPF